MQIRKITGQFPDAVFQFVPVIDPFAKDDLSVHLNPRLIEYIRLFQRFSRETVVQHPAAQLGIHRLERNIDRLQTVFYDPLDVMFTHIRQRHIIPLQK